jgi:Second Messenger Oligonucleotide or Dinucleotide Synthetase domain
MPRTIDEGFRDLLRKLTPGGAESDGVKSHRASIKACLENNFGLVRFTRIGSFGNGTSICGCSDVDYLACLPRQQLTSSSNYSLGKVRDALIVRFPNTGVRINCPAVCCPLGTTAAEITEVIAADYVWEDRGYKVYDIADGAGGWMKTSPDAHNAYVRNIDDKLGGKVKPLIRFLKAWKCFRDVPISSFYLELRVAKYASGEKSIIYDIDVKNILKMLFDCQLANMQDPAGISGYIPACSTDIKKQDALSKLQTALTRAENARDEAMKENTSKAFEWWRLLYNSEFPTYYW